MSQQSAIEWTDATWNPVRGCVKVSPGCKSCYAETFAERFRGVPGHPYEQGFDLRLVPEKLREPLRWKKPRRVFVNSMSDLFQDGVPDAYIDQVFAVMGLANQHAFQVLTKRPERMRDHASSVGVSQRVLNAMKAIKRDRGDVGFVGAFSWPLPNVWLGVSVENQKYADERIPLLLQTPAVVRFISAEPLLEDVDLTPHLCGDTLAAFGPSGFRSGPKLDWVIVGGESGPGARPCELAWIRSIRDRCQSTGCACFIKQLGAVPLAQDGVDFSDGDMFAGRPTRKVLTMPAMPNGQFSFRDRKGGSLEEWPADLRVREFPTVTT